MSNTQSEILLHNIFNLFLNRFAGQARIPGEFNQKMAMISDLQSNDYTGLVNTVLEYMIHSGTVDFTFQTTDATLRKALEKWQKNVNAGLSVDIQRGLKGITHQYLRERWKSSFIGMKVVWAKDNGLILPKNIYLVDGARINVKGDPAVLGGYKYTLGKNHVPLDAKPNETLIIRKPFNSWYDQYADPYLVKKGVLYNALLKKELLKKQGDILEAVLPYMLAVKAGSEALNKIGQLPTAGELEALADQVKEIKEEYAARLKSKGMIGAFPSDVSFEHIIPDLTKFFSETIVKPIDRNIMAGLGMIELIGFSSNRQEAILNPKMLIEEVKNAVADLTLIYEDIMLEFVEKNKGRLGDKNIIVMPTTIKSFISEEMKLLARSAYDRGLISKRRFNEDYLELDFEAEVQQIDLENRRNLQVRMFPPVIMNQDVNTVPDAPSATPAPVPATPGKQAKPAPGTPAPVSKNPKNVKPKSKTPVQPQQNTKKKVKALCKACNFVWALTEEEEALGDSETIQCPECGELHLAIDAKKEEFLQAPYETIEQLPAQTNVLPHSAKKLFMKVVNDALSRGLSDSAAFKEAWGIVKKHYEKGPSGKWRRKKKTNKANNETLGAA